MLLNLLHILAVLVHVVDRSDFLVFSGRLISVPLSLQFADFLFPDAQLVQQNGRLGVRILSRHILLLLFFHVAQ